MNKKGSSDIFGILFVILVIIVLLFVVKFDFLGSVVKIRTYENPAILPLQTGTFNFAGYEGTYETPYLGSVSCSGRPGTFYCYPSGEGGNPEREMSFSNSLQDGQQLILGSSITAEDSSTENYIKTKITLPKGELKVYYDYSLYSHQPCQADAITFKIADESKSFRVPCTSGKDHYSNGAESFDLILTEEKEIEISIYTSGSGDYSTEGTLEVTFEVVDTCLEFDLNCDGTVSREELGLFITKWINNQVTRNKLGEAIVAWVG